MAAKYGGETTAEEIAQKYDLTGKNVIVTGGYSGMSPPLLSSLSLPSLVSPMPNLTYHSTLHLSFAIHSPLSYFPCTFRFTSFTISFTPLHLPSPSFTSFTPSFPYSLHLHFLRYPISFFLFHHHLHFLPHPLSCSPFLLLIPLLLT